jgi:chromosome partitioning protein
MSIYYIPGASAASFKVAVLNSKGGCGKSMIASNLACWYGTGGFDTALIDFDPQGSALRWLAQRRSRTPTIHGVNGGQRQKTVTRSWQMRLPGETERVVIDTPAGVRGFELTDLIGQCDVIVIPVLPSDADIHAGAGFIADLLLDARIRSAGTRVVVVANRVKANTRIYSSLQRFLDRLEFPFVAQFSDIQTYIQAAQQGLGICEMRPDALVRREVAQWRRLLGSLEGNIESVDELRSPAAIG